MDQDRHGENYLIYKKVARYLGISAFALAPLGITVMYLAQQSRIIYASGLFIVFLAIGLGIMSLVINFLNYHANKYD